MAQGTKRSLYPQKLPQSPKENHILRSLHGEKGEAKVTVLTPNEIAEVFRKFSRSESLSAFEARPAVFYLLRLKGFSKVEDDCWLFFADCFTWLADKEPVFAEAAEGNSRPKKRK